LTSKASNWCSVLLVAAGCATSSQPIPVFGTFSIVARDPGTGDLGVAVQSRVLAVGAVVPWAKAGVGAVATQAFANPTFGPRGLKLLEEGKTPEEALLVLLESNEGRDERQVGIIDARGRTAAHTGSACTEWAGARRGEDFCVQGNILASEEVVAAMARAFREAQGDLGSRMLAALQAGQNAGGDRRGMQSAALLIVREKGGYGGFDDRYCDLRVDDHEDPIRELARLYRLHREIFSRRPR